MISLKYILFTTTKVVAENFPQDVYIEDNNTQGFDKSCFFVQILPIASEVFNKISNLRSIIVSVKYFQQAGESITNIYDVSDTLERIFGRTLFVDKTYLSVNEVESNIYSDEVGRVLDFMIHLNFNDIKYLPYHGPNDKPEMEYDLMRELHMQFNELSNVEMMKDSDLPIVSRARINIAKLNQ